ncbi:MAG: hypothetical protein QM811_19600 [Pirellulales bacterium]
MRVPKAKLDPKAKAVRKAKIARTHALKAKADPRAKVVPRAMRIAARRVRRIAMLADRAARTTVAPRPIVRRDAAPQATVSLAILATNVVRRSTRVRNNVVVRNSTVRRRATPAAIIAAPARKVADRSSHVVRNPVATPRRIAVRKVRAVLSSVAVTIVNAGRIINAVRKPIVRLATRIVRVRRMPRSLVTADRIVMLNRHIAATARNSVAAAMVNVVRR